MTDLSEENIEYLEEFIKLHNPLPETPCPSDSDMAKAKRMWDKISNCETPITSYYQFGSNSFGMISYGFYKSRSNKIYMIVAYINEVQSCHPVDSNWWFLNLNKKI